MGNKKMIPDNTITIPDSKRPLLKRHFLVPARLLPASITSRLIPVNQFPVPGSNLLMPGNMLLMPIAASLALKSHVSVSGYNFLASRNYQAVSIRRNLTTVGSASVLNNTVSNPASKAPVWSIHSFGLYRMRTAALSENLPSGKKSVTHHYIYTTAGKVPPTLICNQPDIAPVPLARFAPPSMFSTWFSMLYPYFFIPKKRRL